MEFGLDVGREEVPDGEEIAPDEDVPAAPVVPDGTTEPEGLAVPEVRPEVAWLEPVAEPEP